MKDEISTKQEKIILICLDGLSRNLLTRFCEAGFLPNFFELAKNGVSGVLKSQKPILSPRIWASIYTGKTSEKHGVEDFYVNAIKTKQIWDILHEKGEKIGIFNPMTAFEPLEVNGFFVPGLLAPTASAFPPDLDFIKEISVEARDEKASILNLAKYVFKLIKHGCRLSTLFRMVTSYLGLLLDTDLQRFKSAKLVGLGLHKIKEIESLLCSDLFIYCQKKYEPTFSVFYDNGIDFVSHWCWQYYEPKLFKDVNTELVKKYGNAIRDYYMRIDEILGRIVSTLGKDVTLIVVSDHGFKAMPEDFKYLRNEILVNSLIRLLDLEDELYGIKVGKVGFLKSKSLKTDLQQIENRIKEIRVEKNGKSVFKVNRKNERILHIQLNLENIDPTANQDQAIVLPNSSQHMLGDIINVLPGISGMHSLDGVIVMSGPRILKGGKISEATVFDVAPTILALKGMPIPDDMDGKVLLGAFNEPIDEESLKHIPTYDSPSFQSSSKEELSEEEETHIKRRLRELGYL